MSAPEKPLKDIDEIMRVNPALTKEKMEQFFKPFKPQQGKIPLEQRVHEPTNNGQETPAFAGKLKEEFGEAGGAQQESPPPDLEKETREEINRYLTETAPFPNPMREEAFRGLVGQIVGIMTAHCEASSETLLVQCLVMIGSIVGRSAYVYAGGPYLFPNEYVICVGNTARGRKGTALKIIEHLLEKVAPEWLENCTGSELQTGEGVVNRICDERYGLCHDRRRKHAPEEPPVEELIDPGVSDKRLLIIEEEFSYTLKMAQRSGNALTEILRKAWDSPHFLQTSNKNSPLKATHPHISLIGHTTREELLNTTKAVDLNNGFANRMLWVATAQQGLMPNADFLDWNEYPEILKELKEIFRQRLANTEEPYRFKRTPEAEKLWEQIYRKLNSEKSNGFLDAVLLRDTSHVLKLAMIYAIVDQSLELQPKHLQAALAVVDFCQRSACWIFGQSTGNKLANNILQELLRRPRGLTRTEISSEVCYRSTPKSQIDQALSILAKSRLATMRLEMSEKQQRVERWFAQQN